MEQETKEVMIPPALKPEEVYDWILYHNNRIDKEIIEAKEWQLKIQKHCPHTHAFPLSKDKNFRYKMCKACRKVFAE